MGKSVHHSIYFVNNTALPATNRPLLNGHAGRPGELTAPLIGYGEGYVICSCFSVIVGGGKHKSRTQFDFHPSDRRGCPITPVDRCLIIGDGACRVGIGEEASQSCRQMFHRTDREQLEGEGSIADSRRIGY